MPVLCNMCFLFFLDGFYRACACASETCDACVLVALGFSVIIQRKSRNRAGTYTGTAADACFLINCYRHVTSSFASIIALF